MSQPAPTNRYRRDETFPSLEIDDYGTYLVFTEGRASQEWTITKGKAWCSKTSRGYYFEDDVATHVEQLANQRAKDLAPPKPARYGRKKTAAETAVQSEPLREAPENPF